MRTTDNYDVRVAREAARDGNSDLMALASLIANAVFESTHFPANGARVVSVYRDESDGQIRSEDCPVLWFDADHRPVVAFGQETFGSVESLPSDAYSVTYHPDTRYDPGPQDPRALATAVALEALMQSEEKK